MQCDMDASVTRNAEPGPWCTIVVQAFRILLTGAPTGHMDDYDVCVWSLCSPCALLLPLLSSYGEDLSVRCRR